MTTARPGDTYATIARNSRLTVKKLLKYNDETTVPALRPGEMVSTVRPKSKRSKAAS
ncbi:MAG: LysM peptidoglycan-binding domain-containing protein [Alistipes indistinctus]